MEELRRKGARTVKVAQNWTSREGEKKGRKRKRGVAALGRMM